MGLELVNQTAVVTGAGRGIGACISRRLARLGARVFLAARSKTELVAVASDIEAAGGQAAAVPTDVTCEQDVRALFKRVRDEAGAPDILVNNAGIGRFGDLKDLSADDFDRVMDVNARGTFLCCRAAMGLMVPCRSGAIINIASVVGVKGYARQSAYTAAKHAVMGLTKSLAVEAQPHGIRVSVILPGGVDTEMVRRARPDLDPEELLLPEDVAQAVEYLLSLSDRAAVDQIVLRRRRSSPF
jgi:3-oxoacyl-[acyl-carrier protein] reductase